MINLSIFKAYDIRGIYPDEISEGAVFEISRALISFLENQGAIGSRQIVVGRDARLSSNDLAEAAKQGLLSQAVDVIDVGRVSAPFFYWTIINEAATGGVMVTASHNPTQYNGLKLCGEAARPIAGNSGLKEIKELATKQNPAAISASAGKIIAKDLLAPYLDFIKSKIDLKKIEPLKIVMDCGNGMMGPEIKALFKDLPCETEILFGEPDGAFLHHEPNLLKEEYLIDLRKAVLDKEADLGAAFDGDGDRIVFIDERGEMVRGDFMAALIAQDLLKTNPGAKIFYDARTSRAVPEIISASGGEPILGRAGHSFIKEQMRREDILFGGETAGHYFFKELGFVDNALFALLRVLSILSAEQKSFSTMLTSMKKYYQSGEISLPLDMDTADQVLKKTEEFFNDGQIKKIDGLTIEYPDWWFNLRLSNTEPLIRLNSEAVSEELMKQKLAKVRKIID